MDQSPLAAQMSGNVLYYQNPEPLTPEHHGSLGVKRVEHPYAFVSKSHIVPLTVTEFAPCSLSYPIVFIGAEAKTPLAVMGLRKARTCSLIRRAISAPTPMSPPSCAAIRSSTPMNRIRTV